MSALVVAMTEKGVIGREGRLPWHIPEDLQHFRKRTLHRPVIMGRNTWNEIYERLGTALPKRRNIVLTSRALPEHAEAEAIAAWDALPPLPDAMIIGGARVYELCLPYADRIYMTRIFGDYEGDVFFPKLNPDEWQEEDYTPFKTHAFLTLKRRKAFRRSH